MSTPSSGKAWLVLEDGSVVEGESFGASGTAYGELVFNTGMTGYQESLTDPSYNGQVLMFTYPMIGNYGVNEADWESDRVWPRAVVVREWCRRPDHRQSTKTLHIWLTEQGVPGIAGIDTRALTLKTREKGCLRCFVTDDEAAVPDLLERIASMPSVETENLAGEASVSRIRRIGRGEGLQEGPFDPSVPTVAVIDTGIKRNILRNLQRRFNIIWCPWDTPSDAVLASNDGRMPDGLFLANGPGDPGHPEIVAKTVATIRALSEKLPTFGICYGNQLISRAWGASTHKMRFGHRGANIPVRDEGTHRIRITSQNHGFAVDADSVESTPLRIWERCPNDGTVEGLVHNQLPIFTTQYHPEAAPGPWDSGYLFDAFGRLIHSVQDGTFVPGHFPLEGKSVAPFAGGAHA